MTQRYRLTTDDDSHWFVIPVEKSEEWGEYCEKVTRFWEEMPDGEGPPEEPEWAVAVGGAPGRVQFGEYEIE